MEQLSFDIKRDQEIEYTFKNYEWLIGNPANLKIFFEEQLVENISPELKADARRRLDLLIKEKRSDVIPDIMKSTMEKIKIK